MKDRESWEKFQGKCTNFCANLKTPSCAPDFTQKVDATNGASGQLLTLQKRIFQRTSQRSTALIWIRFENLNWESGRGLAVFNFASNFNMSSNRGISMPLVNILPD
jgi:hypothetical protein